MPVHFDVIFFTVGQITYRLHFPYLLEGFEKSMLARDENGKFTSDTREYYIRGYKYGGVAYDIRVREFGADIFPGYIDAWFSQEGVEKPVDPVLLESIRARKEEATQNRIPVNINGKPV